MKDVVKITLGILLAVALLVIVGGVLAAIGHALAPKYVLQVYEPEVTAEDVAHDKAFWAQEAQISGVPSTAAPLETHAASWFTLTNKDFRKLSDDLADLGTRPMLRHDCEMAKARYELAWAHIGGADVVPLTRCAVK